MPWYQIKTLQVRGMYAVKKPGAPSKKAEPAAIAKWRGWPRYNDTNVESDSGARPSSTNSSLPLSSEYGTYKTVNTGFWNWLSGKRASILLTAPPFAWNCLIPHV